MSNGNMRNIVGNLSGEKCVKHDVNYTILICETSPRKAVKIK